MPRHGRMECQLQVHGSVQATYVHLAFDCMHVLCFNLPTPQEVLARALYALEAAWHPQFDIKAAQCRLDFEVEENRGLYGALFRHVQVRCTATLCMLLSVFVGAS